MIISLVKASQTFNDCDLLVLPISAKGIKANKPELSIGALDKRLAGTLSREIALFEFKAQLHRPLLVQCGLPGFPRNVLLIGWEGAPRSGYNAQLALRKLGNIVFEQAKSRRAKRVLVQVADLQMQDPSRLQAFCEGLLLSSYCFTKYKTDKKVFELQSVGLLSPRKIAVNAIQRAEVVSRAVSSARDFVNMPAVDCTPPFLVAEARRIAKEQKLGIKVCGRSELRKMKADLMLSVFDGSNEEPSLIRLHYKPRGKAKRKVALVGKGVTFDTGGLCIKSGPGMYEMKQDMAGAAAVLTAIEAIAKLKVPVEVIGFCPVTENMINTLATKPGNVVRALNGKTVEILNTDAEGRLILGDALVLAEKEQCSCIIDLATLTGSVANFLGSEYSGLFASDDGLAEKLLRAAQTASERLVRLPLAPEYRDRLKSPIAELKNIGGAEAGGILGALFLSEFVEKTPWAHIDIAGPAYIDSDRGFNRKGATGVGVRTILQFLQS